MYYGNMQITDYAIIEIARLVCEIHTGTEWVAFFCSFGARDVYDAQGLPDIGKPNGQRPSKKEYIADRLKHLNNTENMRNAIARMASFNEYIAENLNEILRPEHYAVELQDGVRVVVGGVAEHVEPVVNQAHFQDIQRQILNELDWAKVSIRVVVAWFTNEVLAQKLRDKFEAGLDVQVAYYDDGINARYGVDLGNIPTYPIRAQHGGTMHDKFCVLDNQHVITGSYNWSSNAEFRNDENITIEHDSANATRYSLEFRRLTGVR